MAEKGRSSRENDKSIAASTILVLEKIVMRMPMFFCPCPLLSAPTFVLESRTRHKLPFRRGCHLNPPLSN